MRHIGVRRMKTCFSVDILDACIFKLSKHFERFISPYQNFDMLFFGINALNRNFIKTKAYKIAIVKSVFGKIDFGAKPVDINISAQLLRSKIKQAKTIANKNRQIESCIQFETKWYIILIIDTVIKLCFTRGVIIYGTKKNLTRNIEVSFNMIDLFGLILFFIINNRNFVITRL